MNLKISIIIATRNRRSGLEAVLSRQLALPERPRVVVVDDGSTDGTAGLVSGLSGVDLVPLGENQGGAARTIGALAVETPYVAFSDDPGSDDPRSARRARPPGCSAPGPAMPRPGAASSTP